MMHDDPLSFVGRQETLLTSLGFLESTSKRNMSKPCGYMSGLTRRSETPKLVTMGSRRSSTKRTTPKFW